MRKFKTHINEYEDVAQSAVAPVGYRPPSVLTYNDMAHKKSGKKRTSKGMDLQLKWLKKRIKQ